MIMAMMKRVSYLPSAVVVCVVLVGGCGAGTPAPSPSNPAWAVIVDGILENAREAGAAEAQLTILEDSRLSGEVTFAQLSEAVEATFQCFEDADIVYRRVETAGDELMPVFQYEFQGPPEGNPVADACIERNSLFVEWAYANQPRAEEAINATVELHRDEIRACLLESGIEVPEDATGAEIREASKSLTQEEWEAVFESGRPTPEQCIAGATGLSIF